MLLRFNLSNHPQQVQVRGPSRVIDERMTPADLFAEYDRRFHFTLDVAASETTAKTALYYSLERDGLAQPWAGHSVWCNPPYSSIEPWVIRARDQRDACRAIVMLLPANRTEQPFWQRYIEPFRDGRGPIRTEFIARRRNFGTPGREGVRWHSSPPFGLVAVIF